MKKIIFILGLCGVAFAGYLSAVKFFSQTCAFGESCPYFWGYPACYYGLAMFTIITIASGLGAWKIISQQISKGIVLIMSFLGILFAGYFTLLELPLLFTKGFGAYLLGLPTCAMGLIFYIAIFIIALIPPDIGKFKEKLYKEGKKELTKLAVAIVFTILVIIVFLIGFPIIINSLTQNFNNQLIKNGINVK